MKPCVIIHRLSEENLNISLSIKVRKVFHDDCLWIYQWRNHPATRKFSRDAEPISYEAHCEWFRRTLNAQNRRLLVVEEYGEPIGVIRFDFINDDLGSAEISIYVDPEKHGAGLGYKTLQAGIAGIMEDAVGKALKRFVATVNEGNRVSQALFLKAGFVPAGVIYIKEVNDE